MRNNCGMIKRSRHEHAARWRAVLKMRKGKARKRKPERLTRERRKRNVYLQNVYMKEDALSYSPEPELQISGNEGFGRKCNDSLSTILVQANIDNAKMKQSERDCLVI